MKRFFWIIWVTLFFACIDIYQWGRDNPCDPNYQGAQSCESDSGADSGGDIADLGSETDVWEDADAAEVMDVPGDLVCPDICPPEAFSCHDLNAVSTCILGEDQCFQWMDGGTCGTDSFDQARSCNTTVESGPIDAVCCQNECLAYDFECLTEEQYRKCGLDGFTGCIAWNERSCEMLFACQLSINMCVDREFQVSDDITSQKSNISIQSINNHRFAVVWQALNQISPISGTDIFGKIYSSIGTSITSEFLINTFTTGDQDQPQVSRIDDNRFVVVWKSYRQDGDSDGIYGQLLDSQGQFIKSEFRINLFTTNYQSMPLLAVFDSTRFAVIWESTEQISPSSFNDIFCRIFDSNWNPISNEVLVNQYTSSFLGDIQIAVINPRQFVVVWKIYNQADDMDIYARILSSEGNYISSEFPINLYTGATQTSPQLKVIDENRFVVVWQSFKQVSYNSDFDIFGRIFDNNGNPHQDEFLINSQTAQIQRFPQIATISAGQFVVIWESYCVGCLNTYLQARIYKSDGIPINSEFPINNATTVGYQFHQVFSFGSGQFIVLWKSEECDFSAPNCEIYIEVFEDDGVLVSDKFQVDQDTILTSPNISIAPLSQNRFVIGWRWDAELRLRIFYQ